MVKKRDELKNLKQFGLVLSGLLAVFGITHYARHHIILSEWFFGIGLALLFVSMFIPKALKPIYNVFLKVAHAIGWFNTRLILIFIYFIILTPIGLLMRLFGRNPLKRNIEKNAPTYWIKRPMSKAAKKDLEKQF